MAVPRVSQVTAHAAAEFTVALEPSRALRPSHPAGEKVRYGWSWGWLAEREEPIVRHLGTRLMLLAPGVLRPTPSVTTGSPTGSS